MHWLIQSTLNESTSEHLVNICQRFDIPYQMVKCMAFTRKIIAADTVLNGRTIEEIPELQVSTDLPIMTYGSYGLALASKDRGWSPGAFLNVNFTHDVWKSNWSSQSMLNEHSVTSTLESAKNIFDTEKIFVRPLEDTKSFSGMVLDKENFNTWKEQVLLSRSPILKSDTEIIVAPFRKILSETRLFVVDGEVITSSLYKLGPSVLYDSMLIPEVLDFAKKKINEWQPDRAFVFDVAQTEDGPKIIEVNNINSSGVYAADFQKIVLSIDSMDFNNSYCYNC